MSKILGYNCGCYVVNVNGSELEQLLALTHYSRSFYVPACLPDCNPPMLESSKPSKVVLQ
jgi:hypothetical protein